MDLSSLIWNRFVIEIGIVSRFVDRCPMVNRDADVAKTMNGNEIYCYEIKKTKNIAFRIKFGIFFHFYCTKISDIFEYHRNAYCSNYFLKVFKISSVNSLIDIFVLSMNLIFKKKKTSLITCEMIDDHLQHLHVLLHTPLHPINKCISKKLVCKSFRTANTIY